MKILILYTHNKSFLASFFYEVSLGLIERGYEVKVFSLKTRSSAKSVPEIVELSAKGNYFSNSLKIFRVIKAYQPSVIISNFSYVNPALVSGKLLGVKQNIVWFHTLTAQLEASRKQLFIKSLFLNLASKIIVNSELLQQDLIHNYRQNADKITPVPFWASTRKKNTTKEDKFGKPIKIGCPGRLEEVKNQRLLIESLSLLDKQGAIKLFFAGNGSGLSVLKKIVDNYGLKKNVEFLGVLTILEMESFYKDMDLVVLPSKFEAFGLVFIEALSLNCPVIVSNKFGALAYIKDEEFLKKFTFDPNDSIELKDKIQILLKNGFPQKNYFKKIYEAYFQKKVILNQIEKVINS